MERRQGKGRRVSKGLFKSETKPTYVLRARLELEAEEKAALYQDRKLLYSAACVWYDLDSEQQHTMIMFLVEADFMDFEVVELARILALDKQLRETAHVIQQRITPILGMEPDLEVVVTE